MSYQVLARRWRPQRFQEVVGQDHVTRTLINAIKNERLAHAYLFSGPRGVGKTTVARIFAKAINCEDLKEGEPCNRCRSCVEITEGISVDVQEIDGASNRRIEEIRELRENIRYLPSHSRYKIYIIDEVHMLTKEAFNALLKTLEEPPDHAKFIFATTEPHKVPLTILSRCQRFDFKRIPVDLIVSHLERITKAEGVKIDKSSLFLIARQAEGSMRDAQSLLDQVISYAGKEIKEKDVVEALGILDRSVLFELIQAIYEGSSERCLKIIDDLYNHGYDIKVFYHQLIEHLRNLIIALINPEILDMTNFEKKETEKQASLFGIEKLQFMLDILISKEQEIMYSYNPRFLIETVLIRLSNIDEFLSLDEILRRLDNIEKRLGFIPEVEEKKQEKEEKSWEGFLKFLSSRNKIMFNVLKGWELVSISENSIEIRPNNEGFSASYFKDNNSYELLKEYCKEYFGKEITPKLLKGKKKKKKVSEAVQEVLNLFQGQIIEEEKGGKT